MRTGTIFTLCCALASAALVADTETLDGVLDRMDRAARAFEGLTAQMKRDSYTAIIQDHSVESGTIRMRRTRSHEIEALWNLTEPGPKTYQFHHRAVRIYLPGTNQVQNFDISKDSDQLDQFLLLGFGTTKSELQKSYAIQLLGREQLGGVPVAHLQLTPKSAEVLQYVKQIELWISDENGYPVQEKVHQNAGDYTLITYSGLKFSPVPSEQDLELKLPSGVQQVYPGK